MSNRSFEAPAQSNLVNSPVEKFPIERTIHSIFERKAQESPNRCAIRSLSHQTTYCDLINVASNVAQSLLALGLRSSDIVAICMTASSSVVGVFLGVMKIGGIQLYLNPNYPRERLNYYLRDACPKLVIYDSETKKLVDSLNCSTIEFSKLNAPSVTMAPITQESDVCCDDPAFLIYTSGTTGTQKGVVGSHRVMINGMNWERSYLSPDINKRNRAPLSFTTGLWELLPLGDAEVVVVTPEFYQFDAASTVQALSTLNVNLVTAVPSIFQALLSYYKKTAEQFHVPECWMLTGETLNFSLRDEFVQIFRNSRLINCYGLTEFWDATAVDVTNLDLKSTTSLPLGTPIPNVKVHILDSQHSKCPSEVTGEIFLEGAGIALGYLNDLDSSSGRFITLAESSKRLLRTGDYGYMDTRGVLWFKGRDQSFVKIRGNRISLSEIENQLRSHSSLCDVAVTEDGESDADTTLCVHYVPKPSTVVTGRDLKQYLENRLPRYMIPNNYQSLSMMPVTPSGKIDKLSLSKYVPGRTERLVPFQPATTKIEKRIVTLLNSYISVNFVGIDDDLFTLGIDSLSAMMLLTTLEFEFNIQIPLSKFITSPSIRNLAEYINLGATTSQITLASASLQDRNNAMGEGSPENNVLKRTQNVFVVLKGGGSDRVLLCIHPIDGSSFCYSEMAANLVTSCAVVGVNQPGLRIDEEPMDGIIELANYYSCEIQRKFPCSSIVIAGWSMGGVIGFELVRQLKIRDVLANELVLLDTIPPHLDDTHHRNLPAGVQRWLNGLFVILGDVTEYEDPAHKFWSLDEEQRLRHALFLAKTENWRAYSKFSSVYELDSRLKLAQANVDSLTRFTPEKCNCNITFLRAASDEDFDSAGYWRQLTNGEFRVVDIQTSHGRMLANPHASLVAKELDTVLNA